MSFPFAKFNKVDGERRKAVTHNDSNILYVLKPN